MEISHFTIIASILIIYTEIMVVTNSEIWPLERPDGMPTIQSLEVMCGKDHMDVHLQFSQPFEGIVSSKGQYGDPRCVYVPPSSGKTYFTFRIAYARCGTKPDLNGQFYENTVVVQYDKDLLEVWDEAKRLRCEWYNDYEKTASKPPMVIADLDVVQLDFRGDNVDCWMEIQHGKGPWAPPVSGIVPLGSTLTLVVAINDYRGEFDMRVKSCAASDGGHHIIQLSDEHGCVLRPKMISRFLKARITDERASVITYAFFHAFKFPDAISVHIKCKVEICRHGCLDHCQLAGSSDSIDHSHSPAASLSSSPTASFEDYNTLERKDSNTPPSLDEDRKSGLRKETMEHAEKLEAKPEDPFGGDLIYDDSGGISIEDGGRDEIMSTDEASYPSAAVINNNPDASNNKPSPPALTVIQQQKESGIISLQDDKQLPMAGVNVQQMIPPPLPIHTHRADGQAQQHHERFPHGPRKLKEDIQVVTVSTTTTSSSSSSSSATVDNRKTASSVSPVGDRKNPNSSGIGIGVQKRRRRSFVISDNKASNANVGVSGLYEVVSEADLAFTPDNKEEAVAVFQGKISQEVVYGVCLPVPGFSAVFILMAASVVASALIAGFLMYRYQVQKQTHKLMIERQRRHHQQQPPPPPHPYHRAPVLQGLTVNSLANWMAFGLIKTRMVPTTAATANNNNNNNNSNHSQHNNHKS